MTHHLISVIIPVYNAERYISKTVQSILVQTHRFFELVLVDDGSSDNSLEICNSFLKIDNRIRVIHSHNQGASMARNIGIQNSTGQLLTFIDADDIIDPDYLKNLFDSFIKFNEPDLLIQGLIQEWPNKANNIFRLSDKSYVLKGKDFPSFFEEVYLNDYSGPYCKLFRRSIILNNNIRFSSKIIYGEDFDFLLNYLRFTRTVATSSIIGYHYIMRDGTVSQRLYPFEKELSGLNQIYTSFISLMSKYNVPQLESMMADSINPYVWRVIHSNYRNGYRRSKRYNNLDKIPLSVTSFFCKTYKPGTIFTKIVKILIRTRKFSLLDFLLKTRLRS